jgi:hypothetical protein
VSEIGIDPEIEKAEENCMSKHPKVPNIHFFASSRTNRGGLLSLAALLLGSLAVPASAQNRPVARVAPEKHFTIPSGARTAVVLQTEPDAACDLHAAGVEDPSQAMRLYGNIEGYVRFHFTPNSDIEDAHLVLDCTGQEAVTSHPLHLHIAASPTDDMPAPEGSVPVPAGSKTLPALTAEAAGQLSDEDIDAQGYPRRPSAIEAPAAYATWLRLVSRPMTILPPHSVTRSDVSHALQGVTEGPANNSHWSGFADTGVPLEYTAVTAEWNVPAVWNGCTYCYSSAWAGLDGAPTVANQDVVQAGTEMDSLSMGSGTATNYYAWTEAYPQQPTAHEVFSVSPGDPIFVFVYVGDSKGNITPVGSYAWFLIQDLTNGHLFLGNTKLGSSFGFLGTSAEWIVERPYVNNGFPQLSDYGSLLIYDATFIPFGGSTSIPYAAATNSSLNVFAPFSQIQQLTMTGSYWAPWYDNNVMSTVVQDNPNTCMTFYWRNFN